MEEKTILLIVSFTSAVLIMAAAIFSVTIGNPLPALGAFLLVTGIILRID